MRHAMMSVREKRAHRSSVLQVYFLNADMRRENQEGK
jgi:hypothetical protein